MKRYSTGDFPMYDKKYIQLKNMSDILTGGKDWNIHSQFYDKRGLMGALVERLGNQEEGDFKDFYKKNGRTVLAAIPLAKVNVADMEKKFKETRKQREGEGLEPLTVMPPEMLEKKLIHEATLDILEEEVKKLQKALKEYVDEKEEEEDKVLKYGMVGIGKLNRVDGQVYGQLTKLDGQKVGRINGVLCIKDGRSQYNGMGVLDYRKLAQVWRKIKDADNSKKLLDLQRKAKAEGMLPPQYYMPGITSDKKLLPPWPKGVKCHLVAKEEEEDSSGGVTRTR